jgi:ATP-dependent DNA helicase RecG
MGMRPPELNPYFASLEGLKGVGPRLLPLYTRLLSRDGLPPRVVDALFHLPHHAIQRTVCASIAECPLDEPISVRGRVVSHTPPPRSRPNIPYRILVEDESGDMTLVFFRGNKPYLEKLMPEGSERVLSGTIELWNGVRQMTHPDRILDTTQFAKTPNVEPIYGLTEGISSRMISKIISVALEHLPALPEWQDEAWLTQEQFPPLHEALKALHQAQEAAMITGEAFLANPARRRLAYDEFLASQLALQLMRHRAQQSQKRKTHTLDEHRTSNTMALLRKNLPFTLTHAQDKAVSDIQKDLNSPYPMLRLIQGDVGSGKTVVALMAMVATHAQGRQAALMAPTDILARQHFERISALAQSIGLTTAVLTGRDKGKSRENILMGLADGSIDLAIGTHALFQEGVSFQRLGLVVIDEQHRFGVHQRLKLGSKGESVDTLVMTATPIPRTLALACFGDMDISVLNEKPAGRQPIATRVMPLDRLGEVVNSLHRALEKGARVYWVCPLVDESETLDLAAAEQRYSELKPLFGDDVSLLHGKMNAKDKDAAMARFASGQSRILVATTVIEVGVDVLEATIMVIEHAERFGLAQLHQLRGRIGRGSGASTCLLLYKSPMGEIAKARLETVRSTEDGFRIAEEDLKLRGEGEILGTRQSGMPDFRLARPEHDGDLLAVARDDARLVITRDPELQSERGKALRILLYLFERDAAVRLLRAG